jgi:hypothetical protein
MTSTTHKKPHPAAQERKRRTTFIHHTSTQKAITHTHTLPASTQQIIQQTKQKKKRGADQFLACGWFSYQNILTVVELVGTTSPSASQY